ncbi:hypothetical protein [Candidatus Frankia alpina]|uniref:hypothetical protein n=1 Tax=Candidatus Frankia alpina TaxID=2699483 RepID=UPI0013D2E0C6|nr:hypothetical protein [Candidatus Frankia alpina]
MTIGATGGGPERWIRRGHLRTVGRSRDRRPRLHPGGAGEAGHVRVHPLEGAGIQIAQPSVDGGREQGRRDDDGHLGGGELTEQAAEGGRVDEA